MFFSYALDFAADGCLAKPVFGSTAGGLPLFLGFWVVESTSAVTVEAAAAVDVEAADVAVGKSWNKPGKSFECDGCSLVL